MMNDKGKLLMNIRFPSNPKDINEFLDKIKPLGSASVLRRRLSLLVVPVLVALDVATVEYFGLSPLNTVIHVSAMLWIVLLGWTSPLLLRPVFRDSKSLLVCWPLSFFLWFFASISFAAYAYKDHPESYDFLIGAGAAFSLIAWFLGIDALPMHLKRYGEVRSESRASLCNDKERWKGSGTVLAFTIVLIPGSIMAILLMFIISSEGNSNMGTVVSWVSIQVVAGIFVACLLSDAKNSALLWSRHWTTRMASMIVAVAFVSVIPRVAGSYGTAYCSFYAAVFLLAFISVILVRTRKADFQWLAAFRLQ